MGRQRRKGDGHSKSASLSRISLVVCYLWVQICDDDEFLGLGITMEHSAIEWSYGPDSYKISFSLKKWIWSYIRVFSDDNEVYLAPSLTFVWDWWKRQLPVPQIYDSLWNMKKELQHIWPYCWSFWGQGKCWRYLSWKHLMPAAFSLHSVGESEDGAYQDTHLPFKPACSMLPIHTMKMTMLKCRGSKIGEKQRRKRLSWWHQQLNNCKEERSR